MAKKRIYDIAKDFDVSSDALVGILRSLKFDVKNHMSFATDEMFKALEKKFQEEKEAVKEEYARKKSQRSKPPATKAAPAAPKPPKAKKTKEKRKKPDIKTVKESVKKTLAQIERGHKPKQKRRRNLAGEAVEEDRRLIRVSEFISVTELAELVSVPPNQLIAKCMSLGLMVTLNHRLSFDEVTMIADEYEYEVEQIPEYGQELLQELENEDQESNLTPRSPVVTIMGHVDHGKSSLLEAISTHNIHIVDGEAGGITQHIGAYKVETDGSPIVFLDTPGHEAFTAMRARGAEVTDIVVLVVAADDGVMEQTKEAVNHARAAGVPIIVAVNKIDKPSAEPERVTRQLSELGLQAEEWGGDTLFVHVSAKTGEGVDKLLEAIKLQAEMLELTANPNRLAEGYIIEAKLDRGRGAVATVLVSGGTLHIGDVFVIGAHHGKVRALIDDQGKPVDEAGPSIPVQIQGLSGVPEAGDEFLVVEDEKTARQISEHRQAKRREAELSQSTRLSLESFLEQAAEGEVHELKIVIKADVQGSIEALREALEKQSTEKVKLVVIHTGVGTVTESDIMLASASEAIVIGFNVRANSKVNEIIEAQGVEVRYYDVIYQAIEDVREAMAGLLAPIIKEVSIGLAEVREVFKVSKTGMAAGCHVSEGVVRRNAHARLLRDGVVVYTGKISSLRRFKDDAREVASGYECGIGLENFNDIKPGDEIEAYELEEIKATLED